MRRALCTAVALATASAPSVSAQDVGHVDVDGTRIAYREVGAGPPLLLVHGFGESWRSWEGVVPDLASSYRLILPDLRGHGDSAPLAAPFDHRDAARDLAGVLDALGLERIRAMGFSSGATALLHLAVEEPERLQAVVLVGGAPYLPEEARAILRGMEPDEIPMAALRAEGLVQEGDTLRARALLREFVGFEDSYRDVNFTPPLLSTIRARVLVVHGDRDPFFPLRLPLSMSEAIPDAHLLVFPGLGHDPYPSDDAGRAFFVSAVTRFLDDGLP